MICFSLKTIDVHIFRTESRFTAPIANCPMHIWKQFAISTSATDSLPTRYWRNCMALPTPCIVALWRPVTVKNVKCHLKRCIGLHTLIVEEISTLLCRIEACLNSRSIAPVSDNLNDYHALTPGHFLIGIFLIAPAELSVLDLNENRLSRWQMVQHITEGFWRYWSGNYLHTLQQRPKCCPATGLSWSNRSRA